MSDLSLIQRLAQATESDLHDIDKQIADAKQQIAALKWQIESYQALRRVLEAKVHSGSRKPKPKTDGEPSKNRKSHSEADDRQLQIRMHDLLSKEGSMPLELIAARLNKQPRVIARLVSDCNWFERRDGELHIAKTNGHAKVST